MLCNTQITADVVNDCTKRPVKGLKAKAWAFNNGIATVTKNTNTISNIVKAGAATSYTFEGFKDFMNAGYEAVVTENLPTAYKHKFMLDAFLATAAEKANIDKAENFWVVVERNGSQTEGCFVAYGVNNGLWKTAQTKTANDNNGLTKLEFQTRAGEEEEYSEYVVWKTDYATTLAMLVATES
jgi:hypothetical protein